MQGGRVIHGDYTQLRVFHTFFPSTAFLGRRPKKAKGWLGMNEL